MQHGFLLAQTTKVTGKIYDASSLEPLPFVNIVFKGTAIGGTTDFDGNFSVSMDNPPIDSIQVSYIGYFTFKKKINRGITQKINIPLVINQVALSEIVIKPGENPAHRILREIIKKKVFNDRERLDAFHYEVYNKIEFDINNISKKFQKRRVFKPFAFAFENIDSTSINEKPFLPLFMTETLSDFYFLKSPKREREIIKGSKVAGIENESVSQFMGDMYQKINVYENSILVFGKNFVSPVSTNGLLFYRYYLIDSIISESRKTYQINFVPRRKQELVFSGNMWIADSAFAIERLEMTIQDDANINFVNNFNIIQEFNNTDGQWMLKKDRLVVDFAYQDQTMGVYGRKTTSFSDIKINQPKPFEFYQTNSQNVIVEDGADKRPESYWDTVRHDTLTKNEQGIYQLVDTIQTLPAFKFHLNMITLFVTGHKKIGKFELGPYYTFYSFNPIEGSRYRFGGRTSNDFSKWHEFSGFLAYGLKDQKFKYNLAVKSFITKKPWQLAGGHYKFNYEILGQSTNAFKNDNFIASIFRRNPLTSLTAVQNANLFYERDWFTGFTSRIDMNHLIYSPLGSVTYNLVGKDNLKKSRITISEISLFSRLAINEKYVQSEFTRISLSTRSPILSLELKIGIKGLLGSDYRYQKINLNISDRIRINPIGYFDYNLKYGKIFGQVPYLLFELHPGNETYALDPFAFNLMNYFEFGSDEYLAGSITHHFDGFFLNKIPLLRKLKWREVGTFKGVIGKIKKTNLNVIEFPSTLRSLESKPYMEASAGIENIFKLLRVEALWRLSYLGNPDISKFGIRAAIQFTF